MRLSSEQRKLLQTSAETYNRSLWKVADYLEGRGLPYELADGELIGYVEDPFPGQEQFQGRLCLPYVTRSGVVNLKFRSLDEEAAPKYLNFPGLDTCLYRVESFFTDAGFLAVAEGELDALSLISAGIPAVGVPGVNGWKSHYRRCFEDHSRVYAFADGDGPGRDFANFLSREIKALPIRMPDGEDVNSMLIKEGPEWLRRKIQ